MNTLPEDLRIGVVGLGYVGLPLAVEFSKRFPVIGFDILETRVAALQRGEDTTLECSPEELQAAGALRYSSDPACLRDCNFIVVTVPTPIDEHHRPDLKPLEQASELVGAQLVAGDVVVYESTVYPGCVEEFCVPLLEKASGLVANQDFTFGYSPERINPGDKQRRLPGIVKVTAGSTPEAAAKVDAVYAAIITAGTHRASSIKVAEAAKVIENTQRDLNIALVNELAILFDKLEIDTHEVLEAAGTKWNFLPFKPGLVGGHCIGVDPYYLTFKAESVGHNPEVILSGRRINESMPAFVAGRLVKEMSRRDLSVNQGRVLVCGLTFKENCPDLRNSKVFNLVRELQEFGLQVDVWDPTVEPDEVEARFGIRPLPDVDGTSYGGIILAVAHAAFDALDGSWFRERLLPGGVLYDLKAVLPRDQVDLRL